MAKSKSGRPLHPFRWNGKFVGGLKRRVLRSRPAICTHFGIEDGEQLNGVFDTISRMALQAWIFMRDTDGPHASSAQQLAALKRLKSLDDDDLLREWHQLPGGAEARVAARYEGGKVAVVTGEVEPEPLREAIEKVVDELSDKGAGRPKGSGSLALQQLSLGLAVSYHAITGKAPTRARHLDNPTYQSEFADFIDCANREISDYCAYR